MSGAALAIGHLQIRCSMSLQYPFESFLLHDNIQQRVAKPTITVGQTYGCGERLKYVATILLTNYDAIIPSGPCREANRSRTQTIHYGWLVQVLRLVERTIFRLETQRGKHWSKQIICAAGKIAVPNRILISGRFAFLFNGRTACPKLRDFAKITCCFTNNLVNIINLKSLQYPTTWKLHKVPTFPAASEFTNLVRDSPRNLSPNICELCSPYSVSALAEVTYPRFMLRAVVFGFSANVIQVGA
jgi:hypothetical protein